MFSLRALFLSIAFASVCIGGFVFQTAVWASVVLTMALGLLIYGVAASYILPDKRSFFVPACAAGIIYALAAFCQPLGVRDGLITHRLLFDWWCVQHSDEMGQVFRSLNAEYPDRELAYSVLSKNVETIPMIPSISQLAVNVRSLEQIGHSTIAILLSVVTGVICSYVARKRLRGSGVGQSIGEPCRMPALVSTVPMRQGIGMDAEERVKQLQAELEALAATIEQVSSQARRVCRRNRMMCRELARRGSTRRRGFCWSSVGDRRVAEIDVVRFAAVFYCAKRQAPCTGGASGTLAETSQRAALDGRARFSIVAWSQSLRFQMRAPTILVTALPDASPRAP